MDPTLPYRMRTHQRVARSALGAVLAMLALAVAQPVEAAAPVRVGECGALPQPLAEGQRKFHPGHYVAVGRKAARQGFTHALAPGVVGVHLRYRWAELEPEQGRYDFSLIERDLAAASERNVQLVAMIEDKTFDYSAPTPEYLRARYTVPGHRGFTAARWDPYVLERFGLLIRRIGERFDCHPNFEGIAVQESSPSVSDDALARWGYTPEKYRDALIAMLRGASRSLPRSRVFWYMNFLPGGQSYLGDIAAALVGSGVVMGGPDVLPDNRALTRLVYPMYGRFQGQLKLFCSMQHDSYRHPRSKAAAEGEFWSMDDLYAFARDSLHVNYLFWEYRASRNPRGSHDWSDAREVIARNPTIRGKRGRRKPASISSRRSHSGDPQQGVAWMAAIHALDHRLRRVLRDGRTGTDFVRRNQSW